MKTPFLVGQSWKKHFGKVTFLRYHCISSVAEHGNKQTDSNVSRTTSMHDVPTVKSNNYSISHPNIPCKLKTFNEYQTVNVVHDSYSALEKHMHEHQTSPNNQCARNMFTVCHNADLIEYRGFITHGKHCHKTLFSQNSSSYCRVSNLLNSANVEFCASRFFCSSVTDCEYKPCYIFKYIVHTKVLSRLKIYQTLATIMAIPPVVYLNNIGKLTTVDMYAMLGITSVACVMLYVMSLYFRRIVGMISVCKENGMVRLSHLTFWGKRKDVYLMPEDIVPLMDMSESGNKVYTLVKTYNSDQTYILFLRFHKILDNTQLESIFGPLK